MIKNLLSILLVTVLAGCATAYDVDLNEDYMTREEAHDEYQYLTLDSLGDSIEGLKMTVTEDADPRDKALAAITNLMLAREIRELKYHHSQTKAPRLNTDNIEPITKATIGLAPFVAIERIVDKTTSEIGDENYNGEDINVTKTEVHTTTLGDNNETDSDYEDTEDNSIEVDK